MSPVIDGEVIPTFTQEWWIVNFITVAAITLLLLYTKKLKDLDKSLKRFVFGQDKAIDEISASIRLSRAGLRDQQKPIGSCRAHGTPFLFSTM